MNVELIASTPDPERLIERCARISHGSKVSDTLEETRLFIMHKLVDRHEESPLEHASATFFISGISRVCSHQIVRHRLASYTQSSGRYVESGLEFVNPFDVGTAEWNIAEEYFEKLRSSYRFLIESLDVPKENARFILPQAETTSMYMTANFREWRHFLKLRTDRHAQREVREVATLILFYFRDLAPSCVCDIFPVIDDTSGK